jgi:hypothetical protein
MTPDTKRRHVVWEASVLLAAVRLAERVLPSAWLFRWAARRPRRVDRFAVDEILWVTWAVQSVGADGRMGASDLARALTAHAMLRRRGVVSRLCLGVVPDGDALAAHVWLERGDEVILGHIESPRFVRVAQFGGEGP